MRLFGAAIFLSSVFCLATSGVTIEQILQANRGRHVGKECFVVVDYDFSDGYHPWDLYFEHERTGALTDEGYPSRRWNLIETEGRIEIPTNFFDGIAGHDATLTVLFDRTSRKLLEVSTTYRNSRCRFK